MLKKWYWFDIGDITISVCANNLITASEILKENGCFRIGKIFCYGQGYKKSDRVLV